MERRLLWLTQSSHGDIYRAILDYSPHICSAALLAIRSSDEVGQAGALGPEGQEVIDRLRPFLLFERRSSEWPGTQLFGHTATVLTFSLESGCVEILKEAANRFCEWRQPALPEDLCLLRQDGSPWLITIAHEGDTYFKLSGKEKMELMKAIPALGPISKDEPN
jgi:hypothetical protein